jgi:hypothetical protein
LFKRRHIRILALPPAMPKCWDNPSDWQEWGRLNKIAGPVDRKKSLEHFCNDCTPEYSERMNQEGRCAYPYAASRPEKVKPRE